MPISKLTSLPFPPPAVPPFSASGQGLVASVNQLIDTSVASLKSLPASPQTDTVYNVIGFYADSSIGGGQLVWQPSSSKSLHNGVTYYAPEAIAAWNGTQADIATLLNWTGAGSGVFARVLDGFIAPEMAGAVADGASDNRLSIAKWGQLVIDSGFAGTSGLSGECLISGSVILSLNGSASFSLPSGLTFKAASGFPAQKLFLINTGTGSEHVFKWCGGRLNGENIPLSGAGQANDIFYFVAQNSLRCELYFDSTYSGEDWLNSGADSHVFVSGSRNIRVEIGSAIGAFDAAVYVSGDFNGLIGDSCEIYGNYSKCNVAAIVKRRFKTVNIDILTTDCLNGGGTGGADISGFSSAPGADGVSIKVNSLRTERSAFLQATKGAKIDVIAREIGVSIAGYTSAAAFTCLLSGSSDSIGSVVASGVNPSCTVNSNFVGVRCEQRVFATGTYNPADNTITVQANGIGRSVSEDAVGERNFFIINENSNTTASTISGTASASILRSGGETAIYDSFVRLSNALRAQNIPNAVNNLRLSGSVSGAASGAVIATEGDDANIPITISPKGTGNTYVGGNAGVEGLRVGKGGVNALEIPTSATGNPVNLIARGADASVDLQLSPKGAGRVRFGNFTVNADAPVTGYIEIKDASGTTRKLAVIA